MSNSLSVNLRRFRKIRQLTQEALANGANISRVAYRNIEAGSAAPRSETVEALAKALKVKVFELFAPVMRPQTLRFRALKTMTAQERAEREQLIIDAMNWLTDFNELEEKLNERIQPVLPDDMPSADIGAFAESVRSKVFGVDCKGCLPDICDILENGGYKIKTMTSDMRRLFGFSIGSDDGGPAIAVNASQKIPVERRIFTVAHELGHLLLHRKSFDPDVVAEDNDQEKEADLFASHFLMPSDQFNEEWTRNRGLNWVDRVMKAKRTFRVSWMTVLYRLCEINQAEKDKIFLQFKFAYEAKTGRELSFRTEPDPIPPASSTRLSQEPARLTDFDFCEDRFERLVREALEKNEISVSRAAEMLNKSVMEVRDMLLDWKEHQ